MNRRSFLKVGALAAVGTFLPFSNLALANPKKRTDPESQWCYWMMENLTACEAGYCIKEYGFTESRGKVCSFFEGFIKRQPEIRMWLRNELHPDSNSTQRKLWDSMKEYWISPLLGKQWYLNMHKKHSMAMKRFGFSPPSDHMVWLIEEYERRS